MSGAPQKSFKSGPVLAKAGPGYLHFVNTRTSHIESISLCLYSFLIDFTSAQVAYE